MPSVVYEQIKASRPLPSPTGIALQILELARRKDSTIEQITRVVESDPATASRLLKLINSPLAGMPRQIASVQRAVALLGVRTTTSLALGFSLVADHRHGQCVAFDYEMFWSDAVGRAAAARHIADRVKNFAPDEAFTCGLLSQIGCLAFATAFPEKYAAMLQAADTDEPQKLATIERTTFNIDRYELTAEMMGDWHIPAIFREAARAQGLPDQANLEPGSRTLIFAKILHLSGVVARILTHPTIYRDMLSALVFEANQLGISPHIYHDVFDAISEEWRQVAGIFSVRTRRVPSLAEMYSLAQERQGALTQQTDTGGLGPQGAAHAARG